MDEATIAEERLGRGERTCGDGGGRRGSEHGEQCDGANVAEEHVPVVLLERVARVKHDRRQEDVEEDPRAEGHRVEQGCMVRGAHEPSSEHSEEQHEARFGEPELHDARDERRVHELRDDDRAEGEHEVPERPVVVRAVLLLHGYRAVSKRHGTSTPGGKRRRPPPAGPRAVEEAPRPAREGGSTNGGRAQGDRGEEEGTARQEES